jgi:hypothetical protein
MGRSMKNERRGGNEQKEAPDRDREMKGTKGGNGKSGDRGKSRSSKVWGAAKKV